MPWKVRTMLIYKSNYGFEPLSKGFGSMSWSPTTFQLTIN